MTAIITVEEFEKQQDKELAVKAGKLLQKLYPGYGWGVRVVAKQMIQLGLMELINFGENHGMVVNPKDWDTQLEFEALVKKLGGELLERAALSRARSQGLAVTKRPDGFDPRFDRTITTQRIALR